MNPTYNQGNVQAICPDCGTLVTFEASDGATKFGRITINGSHTFERDYYSSLCYLLLRCAGCWRGGIAKVYYPSSSSKMLPALEWFYPTVAEMLPLPKLVPAGVLAEFREAEKCAGAGAWRAASAMLRSGLEKMLIENGYTKGNLKNKIDEAAQDHVITRARMQRAHDEVRVLGNDIMHDEWRLVTQDEYELAHHYVQRIAEDFYDDRTSVEKLLQSVGKLPPPVSPVKKPS